MSKFSIYSKDGSIIRYAGEPKYTGTFMGVSYIEFSSIDSPVPIPWERGDYVDYYRIGKRFRLYSRPEPKKQARRGESGASFIYSNVKFYASTKDLEIAPFRDLVPADNDIHFSTRPDVSTYESVYGIAARIQECMDDIFPGKWAIEVFDTSDPDLLALFNEQKEFSVSNGSCLGALSQIYEVWKNVGWVHTYDSVRDKEIITIGRTSLRDSENTSDSYAYGIGNGLTSLKKAAANEDEFATRLYVYGSERNIQTRYYNGLNIHDKDSVNIVNLMLPPEKWGKTAGLPDARKAYLQADDALIEKYGLIPRTVYFDGNENEEIYPSITGLTCADVRAEMLASGVPANRPNLPPDNSERIDLVVSAYGWTTGDKEETQKYPTFDMHLRQMGFNIAEQGKLTSEGMATISMKSGACAGREFKVKSYALDKNNQPYLSVEKSWDDSLGMSFPNGLYPIVAGDQFVLLDIPMPDYYITLAQKRLLEAGEKLLSDYTRVSPLYEPSVDSFKVKKGTKILQEGMYMQVYDKDIIDTEDNRDYILIDSLSIDEKGDLPTYKVTLREQKRSGRTFGTLEGMIEDAKKSTDDEIKRQRIYTDRRFRSAQETISMLQEAFDGYTEGINPVTIETMSLLVGNEALQFKFTATRDSLSAVPCPLSYNNDTKQLSSVPASLIHLTLGIDAITTQSMPAGSYMSWDLPEWYSAQLDDPSKRYYVYAKVSVTAGGEATYLLSETAIGMSEVEGYYHLLIGIINSEYVGARDFVTVYGFTEVLPGQITTDIIRDADSNLIIDLLNATITAKNGAKIIGDVEFGTNSSGLSNLSEWQSLENEVGSLGVSVQKVQDQVDGVVENWNGEGAPLLTTEPTKSWVEKSDGELIAHINDTYINIEKYKDDATTPTAGQAWRWCQCTEDDVETESITLSGYIGAPTMGVNIGTLPLRLNYTSNVRVYKDKELLGTVSISSLGNSATINGLQIITTTSGLVSIMDTTPDGANIGNIDVEFEYYDYIQVKDNEDNVLNLHWHKIADSDAVRALREAAEATRIAKESATPLNLLAKSAEVLSWESEYTHIRIPLPIRVNAGEKYTFKCEKSMLLTGTHTGYQVKLDAKDDDSATLTPWYNVDFGENNVVVMEVNDGVSDSVAMLTIFKQSHPDSFENKARFQNVSLVKGTAAMPMWQDYQGDNGLKNLINVKSDETIILTNDYIAELTINSGEQYTFRADNISDRGSHIVGISDFKTIWFTDTFGLVNGSDTYYVLTVKEGVSKQKAYLHIWSSTSGQITLTRPTLVKGTRPMMVWKQNTDYLTNAFKNGSTKISGGLVMAQAVMVENEGGTVKGMFNGSNYANDSTNGTLVLAAGSNGHSEASMRAATTRIYDSGKIVTNNIVATNADISGKITSESGKIGGFTIGSNGLFDDTSGTSSFIRLGNLTSTGYVYLGKGLITLMSTIDNGGLAGGGVINVTARDAAFRCNKGMFYGLRPKTRSVTSGDTLTELDHNVFIASGTVYLPSSPLLGQTYKIYHTSTTSLTINGVVKTIKQMRGDNFQDGTTATSSKIEVIELLWSGSYWYATLNRWD